MLAFAHREGLELLRDPIRLIFALLDRDRTPQSRDYIQNLAGSRYFIQRPAIESPGELEQRMRSGELSLAIEIPPGFGRQLKRGRQPTVGVWIDGAMPFRAETVRGYVQGMHQTYLSDLSLRTTGSLPSVVPADIVSRYRYNQSFKSLDAMVPAVIPLLLVFIPAILMALGVVREKELGSITNLYVTPTSRLEFLLGKQLPYIGVGLFSFFGLVALAVWAFRVELSGRLFPTSYFLDISRGAFSKALGFSDLTAFIPVLTLLSVLALRKQDR